MDRIILHSDCNSFYASVEVLHNPELRGKPVSVGGDVENRHGIILASTPEAKRFGIKTGEALWQARQKCTGLIIIPPHYDLYTRFSRMAREIYDEYTDQVEPFGLDESWLDVTGSTRLFGGGMKIAREINARIKYELGITVSIGVSFNKVFAKLGSDYKKPDAITEISRENFRSIVYPLPASDLLYVGRMTTRKLQAAGVRTIGDLAEYPQELLRQRFGKWGDVLHGFANGIDDSPVTSAAVPAPTVKSVGNSTTAPRDLESDEDVKIIFMVLADSVSRRLREAGLKGRVISIGIRDNRLCIRGRQRKLSHFTTLSYEIAETAMQLFHEVYDWETAIRSIGVTVSELIGEEESEQSSLFDLDGKRESRERLEQAVDGVKRRYGTYSVTPAVMLKDRYLAGFDPKEKHNIHPVGYFKGEVTV